VNVELNNVEITSYLIFPELAQKVGLNPIVVMPAGIASPSHVSFERRDEPIATSLIPRDPAGIASPSHVSFESVDERVIWETTTEAVTEDDDSAVGH
jgi:hypothetical protein